MDTGFSGADCVLRSRAIQGISGTGGGGSSKTIGIPETVQNGIYHLKTKATNGLNGKLLPNGLSTPTILPPNGLGQHQHVPKEFIRKSPEDHPKEQTLSYYKDKKGQRLVRKKPAVKVVRESFEACSLIDAIYTYLCYVVLLLVGYANDVLRPRASTEQYRAGYHPLYASFESFYTRHVYRRVRNLWGIPVSSVPGEHISLLERVTPDNGWTFELTGKERTCINLGSYNYLGFAENTGACAKDALKSCSLGIATGSPRLELGSANYHTELEDLVARFLGVEDAITCGMGFATNTLNIPSILSKGCLVLSDEKNHASIILGLRLSGATIRVFKHNNMKSLEKKLREGIVHGQPRTRLPWKKVFIVVEGVYSMEGSIARLPEIVELKHRYGAYIYLDEAHSVGAIGAFGRGAVDYYGLDPKDIDVLMGTFTKSFGSAGGYIAGSHDLIELLRRTSHAHYYGTAMTPPVAQQIITSMKIIMGEDGTDDGVNRVEQLRKNSRYFRQKLKQKGFIIYGNDDSPVVPVALYMPSKITYVIAEMINRGVATVGVGFPATPLVEGRARFCVSAAHTKEMLDKALDLMDEIGGRICAKGSKLPRRTDEIMYGEEDPTDYDDLANEVD